MTADRDGSAHVQRVEDGGSALRIGLSGWQYDGWRGDFYPERLAKRRWLEYVAERFPTVELNGSFYSLQRPDRYRAWRSASGGQPFRFAVKGGRYVTHMLRLRNVETALANFFASGPLELGETLGPVLWQLPETLLPTPEVLDAFLMLLPRSHGAAAELASRHDDKVAAFAQQHDGLDPARLAVGHTAIVHALEVRAAGLGSEHLDVLRRHRVALVDSHAGDFPRFREDTGAPIAYLRLHGAPRTYHDGYSAQALGRWASTVVEHLDAGRDTYVYFDNDAERHAPWDALALDRIVADRLRRRVRAATSAADDRTQVQNARADRRVTAPARAT
ncbi:uncharacterized protein YecE (DUF72 family) [Curtobacterium pusillum]|uniref:Uncharacterized protein YecE (DUF72 family) n=1 Tax=Curtobacterium pusillum TaxID=69373 RepID=A0AAW3T696_9MICO|nr:DUF72 domain-containing protein [Curtobacterium pusillum]MBA8990704.1 uncharacterized protein YecE (DUF72 family) [Curtobacterium pusillum]